MKKSWVLQRLSELVLSSYEISELYFKSFLTLVLLDLIMPHTRSRWAGVWHD